MRVKGKLARPGPGDAGRTQPSISSGRPRQRAGGARWAGSSQLVAFEAPRPRWERGSLEELAAGLRREGEEGAPRSLSSGAGRPGT